MLGNERIINDFHFRKSDRIRTQKDISRVFKEGQSWAGRGLRLNILPNNEKFSRAVFITVKNYGNAVKRNRARRLVSECWRQEKPAIKSGFDVVVVIFRDNDFFNQRQAQLRYILRRASLVI